MGAVQYSPGRWGSGWAFRIAAAAFIVILIYFGMTSTYMYSQVKSAIQPWHSPTEENDDAYNRLDTPSTAFPEVVYGGATSVLSAPPSAISTHAPAPTKDLELEQLLAQLWKPLIHPVHDPVFITSDGVRFEVPSNHTIWDKPLGRNVLIIDVDTRLSNTTQNSLLNPDGLKYAGLPGRTGGYLNHYLYSLIHGYDYRVIKAADYPGRHGTWVKVNIMKEALKKHQFVVFLDSDAVFKNLELPLEWLMSLWNYQPQTLIAMADDIEDPNPNHWDPMGHVLANTGFIIAQASERSMEMMEMWETCPEKIEGCSKWLTEWAHEQMAFSWYIRYAFQQPGEVVAIPCNDANGNEFYSSYTGEPECKGYFVSHLWGQKEKTTELLDRSVMAVMLSRLHTQFQTELDRHFVDGSGVPYPIKQLDI